MKFIGFSLALGLTLLSGVSEVSAQEAPVVPAPGAEVGLRGVAPTAVEDATARAALAAEPAGALDEAACVRVALAAHPSLREVEAEIKVWTARLAEVQSFYYPKVQALTYVAPTFAVKGSALQADVQRDYSRWGPYVHLEALLANPLYSFGRVEAGRDAARARRAVELARLRLVKGQVARAVRGLYLQRAFALSLVSPLQKGREQVEAAVAQAEALRDEGTGKVTEVDVQRLRYGLAEISRFALQAEVGAELATLALRQAMGLPPDTRVDFAAERLDRPEEAAPALAEALHAAAKDRPEWSQLTLGRKAALSWESAERLANAPILFVGGTFSVDWSPVRDDTPNPYHFDQFNRVFGGVGVGFKWDFDPARASARGDAAAALVDQVDALAVFARTGIPLQVRVAHRQLEQALAGIDLAEEGAKAAKKWMTFAHNAFELGTGDARDLLEGLVAWLQARRVLYEAIRDAHLARADLWAAVGHDTAAEAAVGADP